MIGTRIAHYEIVSPLGEGGMGQVFLARDTRLEREVAIKLLPPDLARDPDALALLRREALTLAALNHPGIATIHGFEEAPGDLVALVLEFVPGESLAKRLERGALPWIEALAVCAQVAEALEVAHERGVVHRDLKPGNILLAARGLVKVVDFGIAQRRRGLIGLKHAGPVATAEPAAAAGTDSAANTTMGGAVAGTPGYMSPEQVLAGEQDQRADIFAFGCVLYECLAGRKAFDAPDAFQSMAKVLYEPPDWSALPETLPARIRELLEHCLEKDAERRESQIQSARHELEEALGVRRAAALRAGERPATASNLPAQVTSFVGRERELERGRSMIAEQRLVTLLGMGGSGKTRLALRLAEITLDDHPDGVWFVDLSAVEVPERVVESVAAAVGARAEPGVPMADSLARHIGEQRMLLLLDNCEQVVATCQALVRQLLGACTQLRLMVTSREVLGVQGESVFAVPPLGIPADGNGADAGSSEAVRLFVARAVQASPAFALSPANTSAVAGICRQLDGIPLAIELAAARVRVLAPEQILARLGDRFRLLTSSGGEARHQALRAVIQWSVDHLEEEERRLFRALAVFVGSWSLESALGVYGHQADEFELLDTLQRLTDKSLVVLLREPDGSARYRYLESVRHLALELMGAAGEEEGYRDRHLAWFLELAERSTQPLSGPQQKSWLRQLDLEHEDLLAAHRWSARRPQGVERGLRLANGLARYWSMHGHYPLARRTLDDSLSKATDEVESSVLAMGLVRAGSFALFQGDYNAARPLLEHSLDLYRSMGDSKGEARALMGVATVAIYQDDMPTAGERAEQALALYRAANDRHAMAGALQNLGYIAVRVGDLIRARALLEESVTLLEASGDERLAALGLGSLGQVCARLGEITAARGLLSQALKISLDLGAQREAAYALEAAAEVAAAEGEFEEGVRWAACATALRERIGNPRLTAERAEMETYLQRAREHVAADRVETLLTEGAALDLSVGATRALLWLGGVAAPG